MKEPPERAGKHRPARATAGEPEGRAQVGWGRTRLALTASSRWPAPLDLLDLGEVGQVLEAPRATLGALQAAESHHGHALTIEVHPDGLVHELPVPAHARHLAEEVDVAKVGAQSEVEAGAKGRGIEAKRQVSRRPAQPGLKRGESGRESVKVRRGSLVADVEVLRRPGRSVQDHGHAAYHDVIDTPPAERLNEALEVRDHAASWRSRGRGGTVACVRFAQWE